MQSQVMSRLSVAGIHARTLNSRFNGPAFLVRNKAQGCRPFSDGGKGKEEGSMHLVKAGLPLFLFCGLGVWVVSNGIDGKNKERDAFQGRISKYVSIDTLNVAQEYETLSFTLYLTIFLFVLNRNHNNFGQPLHHETTDRNDKL